MPPTSRPPAPDDRIDPRGYREADKHLLFTLSKGFCYAPGCRVPVVTRTPGKATTSVYYAHIYAAKKGGPRYLDGMSNDERRSFANLLLLCKLHHEEVDAAFPDRYPPEVLKKWKKDREGPLGARMAGLSQLTEDTLREHIDNAITSVTADAHRALEEVAVTNSEGADLLRELVDRSLEVPVLNDDTIALLSGAASSLRHLEDNANILYTAARGLRHLEDNAGHLSKAAQGLRDLPDWTFRLEQTAKTIDKAVNRAGQVSLAAGFNQTIEGLVGIQAELEAPPGWMHRLDELMDAFDFRQKLRWFGNGAMTAGIPLVLTALTIYFIHPSWL